MTLRRLLSQTEEARLSMLIFDVGSIIISSNLVLSICQDDTRAAV